MISKTVRVRLYNNSKITSKNEIRQIHYRKSRSIIEIILTQSQKFHIDKFLKVDFSIRSKQCENRFIKSFPKYFRINNLSLPTIIALVFYII